MFATRTYRMMELMIRSVGKIAPIVLEHDGPTIIERIESFSESDIRKKTGLSRKKLKDRLSKALQDVRTRREISREDFDIITWLSQTYPIKSLFSHDEMRDSIRTALQKEGLLEKGEHTAFQNVADLIALYFITRAHTCEIKISDEVAAKFQAGVDEDGFLGLGVSATLHDTRGSWAFFHTKLPKAEHVEAGSEPDETLCLPEPLRPPDRNRTGILDRPARTGRGQDHANALGPDRAHQAALSERPRSRRSRASDPQYSATPLATPRGIPPHLRSAHSLGTPFRER